MGEQIQTMLVWGHPNRRGRYYSDPPDVLSVLGRALRETWDNGNLPSPPECPGWGLHVWTGIVRFGPSGMEWDGEYRRITSAEALVLAVGEDPLTTTFDETINVAMAERQLVDKAAS